MNRHPKTIIKTMEFIVRATKSADAGSSPKKYKVEASSPESAAQNMAARGYTVASVEAMNAGGTQPQPAQKPQPRTVQPAPAPKPIPAPLPPKAPAKSKSKKLLYAGGGIGAVLVVSFFLFAWFVARPNAKMSQLKSNGFSLYSAMKMYSMANRNWISGRNSSGKHLLDEKGSFISSFTPLLFENSVKSSTICSSASDDAIGKIAGSDWSKTRRETDRQINQWVKENSDFIPLIEFYNDAKMDSSGKDGKGGIKGRIDFFLDPSKSPKGNTIVVFDNGDVAEITPSDLESELLRLNFPDPDFTRLKPVRYFTCLYRGVDISREATKPVPPAMSQPMPTTRPQKPSRDISQFDPKSYNLSDECISHIIKEKALLESICNDSEELLLKLRDVKDADSYDGKKELLLSSMYGLEGKCEVAKQELSFSPNKLGDKERIKKARNDLFLIMSEKHPETCWRFAFGNGTVLSFGLAKVESYVSHLDSIKIIGEDRINKDPALIQAKKENESIGDSLKIPDYGIKLFSDLQGERARKYYGSIPTLSASYLH